MRITVIDLDASREAALLRLSLEALGADVRLAAPGGPSAFFESFDFYGQKPDIAIICGHGDADGLIFPEMAEGVDPLLLPANRFSPGLLAERLGPMPEVVISTACDTGGADFARAFLAAGARTYIAPPGYPDGRAVPILLGLVFYRVLVEGEDWPEAVAAANTMFPPLDGFVAHTG